MLSNKPYLIRAFYQWIVDSGCTPSLLLDATQSRCKVPLEFIEDGQITFNISPDAIRDLDIGKDTVSFRASFSSIVHIVSAPMTAVLAMYAEENQEGVFFEPEEELIEPVRAMPVSSVEMPAKLNQKDTTKLSTTTNKKSVPHLRVVEVID